MHLRVHVMLRLVFGYLGRCLFTDADHLLSKLEGQHKASRVLLPIYAGYDSLQNVNLTFYNQLGAMRLKAHNRATK